MHNAAGDRVEIEPGDRNDTYLEVVSDLVALIDHVRASLKLIERATAQEASLGNQEVCGNVIVLDDVTPRYIGDDGIDGVRGKPRHRPPLPAGIQDVEVRHRRVGRELEHDLRANASRLSRGRTDPHFALTRPYGSGSCARA
jgi:hypothetical protein